MKRNIKITILSLGIFLVTIAPLAAKAYGNMTQYGNKKYPSIGGYETFAWTGTDGGYAYTTIDEAPMFGGSWNVKTSKLAQGWAQTDQISIYTGSSIFRSAHSTANDLKYLLY